VPAARGIAVVSDADFKPPELLRDLDAESGFIESLNELGGVEVARDGESVALDRYFARGARDLFDRLVDGDRALFAAVVEARNGQDFTLPAGAPLSSVSFAPVALPK